MANHISDLLDAMLDDGPPRHEVAILQSVSDGITKLRMNGVENLQLLIHPDDWDSLKLRYAIFPTKEQGDMLYGLPVRVDRFALKGEPKVMPLINPNFWGIR